MREVEVKVGLDCSRLEEVEERVKKLGVLEASVLEEDTYYQHPCRDFSVTDEALRVRKVDGRVELTYKGPKRLVHGVKVRREVTLRVEGDVGSLLEALGFSRVAVIRKRRRYYRLARPAVTVSIDRVEGLGCFVEVEAVEADVEAIEEALRLLGLEDAEKVTKSYLELYLEAYGRQPQAGRV